MEDLKIFSKTNFYLCFCIHRNFTGYQYEKNRPQFQNMDINKKIIFFTLKTEIKLCCVSD